MMQMFAILNWQRDPRTPAYPRRPAGGPAHAVVTGSQLYDAFIACPTATVGGACTQAIIDRIVVSQVNLFKPEKYTEYLNANLGVTSSYAGRLLVMGATGDIDVRASSSDGADLTISVTRPPFTATIDTTIITPKPRECSSSRSSAYINYLTSIAILAAVAVKIN